MSNHRSPRNDEPIVVSAMDRRQFMAASVAIGTAAFLPTERALASTAPSREQDDLANVVLGPIVGHVDETSAMVWMRIPTTGAYRLEVFAESATAQPARAQRAARREPTAVGRSIANSETDHCVHWRIQGLRPATRYAYRIVNADTGVEIAAHTAQQLTTAPVSGAPAKVRFAISSCALEDAGSRAIWTQMAQQQCDAVVLLGDTPYIDSTALNVQTARHRAFAAVPEYQALLRSTPCWWTWDDHDFAGNDASGQSVGKENSRTVYQRYRPQPMYGGVMAAFTRAFVAVPSKCFCSTHGGSP